jgi:hydroxymethylpyrimidine pyrophosphatase-like HAD family hydrolase
MRYTALAVDFDGTIAHDGVVPSRVVDGLERLRASGRRLLLVTGRELEELLSIFPQVALFERVVAENGALLYRPASGERVGLGDPPPARFVELLRSRGVPLALGHAIVATVEPHEVAVLEAIRELGLERQVIFNKGAVMVLPAGVNKASGLAVALDELAISPRNLVAAGDGENDHALLEAAEYSVATANAIATLQAGADRVTRATHGDGVLEVIEDLLADDLASAAPRHRRRTLVLGKDASGHPIGVSAAGASLVVSGPAHERTASCVRGLLEHLDALGYQFCVMDSRGAYLDLKPAIVFGTRQQAPDPRAVLAALAKPRVQAVVCLAGLAPEERTAFVDDLLVRLVGLEDTAGRPHWLVLDGAQDASAARLEGAWHGGIVRVAADARSLAKHVLESADGHIACEGPLGRFTPRGGTAIAIEPPRAGDAPAPAAADAVGRVLRRA